MDTADLLIIYLAIGVPIGVFAVIRHQNSILRNAAVALAFNVVLWPIVGSRLLVYDSNARSMRIISASALNEVERNTGADIAKPTAVFSGRRGVRRLRDMERALEHLSWLTAEIGHAVDLADDPPAAPFSGLIEHSYPKLASKCRHRNNLKRLEFHRARTLEEIEDLGYRDLDDQPAKI